MRRLYIFALGASLLAGCGSVPQPDIVLRVHVARELPRFAPRIRRPAVDPCVSCADGGCSGGRCPQMVSL